MTVRSLYVREYYWKSYQNVMKMPGKNSINSIIMLGMDEGLFGNLYFWNFVIFFSMKYVFIVVTRCQ